MKTITLSLAAAGISAAIVLSGPVGAEQETYEIPGCNVGDNRSDLDQCSQEDKDIGAIIFKVVTEDVPKDEVPEMGFFVCTCGDAQLQIVNEPLPIRGMFDPAKQSAVFIPAINPLCPVIIGGIKVMVTCTVD